MTVVVHLSWASLLLLQGEEYRQQYQEERRKAHKRISKRV